MTQPLITADAAQAQLLATARPGAAGRSIDPLPVVRLFTADAHATWLLAALDPADGDTAYGLIDLGIGMPELGTVKLSDLAAIVGPRKQPVMRDRYFQPVRPLSEYLRLAEGQRFDHRLSSHRRSEAHCDYFGLIYDLFGSESTLLHRSGACQIETVMILWRGLRHR